MAQSRCWPTGGSSLSHTIHPPSVSPRINRATSGKEYVTVIVVPASTAVLKVHRQASCAALCGSAKLRVIALAPQQRIRKRGNVAHVNATTHHSAALCH